MRIARFLDAEGHERWAAERGDGLELLEGPSPWELRPTGRSLRGTLRRLAPLRPTAILGIGLNYRDHAEEVGLPLPERPVVFMKNPASVQDPGGPIRLPRAELRGPETDYEAELAVVIGRPARDVPEERALDYVLGYTAANDVTARRWQARGGGGQWVRAKSFDTFCPLGPVLVTRDELPDPQALRLSCWLSGERVQDGHTSDMVFSVAELVAELSRDTTLLPGTVILTGTPAGVGYTRSPRRFLRPGDRVVVELEGVGRLENPVVAPGEAGASLPA